jgi:hypothetical protein
VGEASAGAAVTLAMALLGSVACVCVTVLVGWRWWLAHALSVAQARLEETRAKVRDIDKEWGALHAMQERLKALEYRTSGR